MGTLPLLKKIVVEEVLDKDKNPQYVDAKDENDKPIYEKDENGNIIMEEKDGKQVKKVKQVVKTREVEKTRALYYPWLTCKKERGRMKEEENEDSDDEADEADQGQKKKGVGAEKCKKCCKDFVRSWFVPSKRKFKCGFVQAQGKFINVRKVMVYVIMIYLFNCCFNWVVLRWNGHGCFDAPKKDYYAPSRSIIMYLTH